MVSAITIGPVIEELDSNISDTSSHDSRIEEIVSITFNHMGIFSSQDFPVSIFAKAQETSLTPPPQEISLASPVQEQKAFNSVTRYLPNCKECLDMAAKRSQEVQDLCDNLDLGEWKMILLAYEDEPENLAIDGLKAFHDGKITMEQFTTLTFAYSLMKEFSEDRIYTQSLFNEDGTVNKNAENFIRQTLQPSGIYEGEELYMDDEKLLEFLESMKAKPESEKVFFFIKTKNHDHSERTIDTLNKDHTITQEIFANTGINIFSQFNHNTTTYRMLPSLSMMQQCLHTLNGKQAVTISPVIGLSSTEDIVGNGRNSTREMALPFPDVILPKEADLHAAPHSIDFINHDFYHAIVASSIPNGYRKAFIEIAEDVAKINAEIKEELGRDEDNFICTILDEFYERIIDMEHGSFRNHSSKDMPLSNPTESIKFIFSIGSQQQIALDRLITKKCQNLEPDDTTDIEDLISDELVKIFSVLEKYDVIGRLAAILVETDFCNRYHINTNDVKRFADLTTQNQKFIREQHPGSDEVEGLVQGMGKRDLATQLLRHMS